MRAVGDKKTVARTSVTFCVCMVFLSIATPVYSDSPILGRGDIRVYSDETENRMTGAVESAISQQKVNRRDAAVDVKNIIPFFEMFLAEPSYSVEDAVQLLGDRQESVGDRVILKPKSREMEWVQLECLKQPEKPFLSDISVCFVRKYALQVSFADLTAKYGEPKMLPLPPPRLKPGGPSYKPDYTYSFKAKGRCLEGNLIVTVDGERHGDPNTVIEVIYRRFPR